MGPAGRIRSPGGIAVCPCPAPLARRLGIAASCAGRFVLDLDLYKLGPGSGWPNGRRQVWPGDVLAGCPVAARQNRARPTQPFIAYSATQATVMVSMVPLGCAESWFCDCRVRFMGMVGHWAGELSEPLETLAQTRPSIV